MTCGKINTPFYNFAFFLPFLSISFFPPYLFFLLKLFYIFLEFYSLVPFFLSLFLILFSCIMCLQFFSCFFLYFSISHHMNFLFLYCAVSSSLFLLFQCLFLPFYHFLPSFCPASITSATQLTIYHFPFLFPPHLYLITSSISLMRTEV